MLQAILSGSCNLPMFAPKVVAAKIKKLEGQGLVRKVNGRNRITDNGHKRILELVYNVGM
jgi:repressor of nif and glnA expression